MRFLNLLFALALLPLPALAGSPYTPFVFGPTGAKAISPLLGVHGVAVFDVDGNLTSDAALLSSIGGSGDVLSTGRSGGQTINGDTASGGALTLSSTFHATKGKIFLGANSVYDQANDRLGIRSTAPAYLAVFHNSTDDTFLGSATFIGQTVNDTNTWSLYTGNNGTTGFYNRDLNSSIWAGNNQGQMAIGTGALGHPTAQLVIAARNVAWPTVVVKKTTSQTAEAICLYDTNETTKLWCVDIAGHLVSTAANESTGAGTALLGTNSPAVTNTAPYTWIAMKSSDGSTVYVPAWK